jgi:hypothetical protein
MELTLVRLDGAVSWENLVAKTPYRQEHDNTGNTEAPQQASEHGGEALSLSFDGDAAARWDEWSPPTAYVWEGECRLGAQCSTAFMLSRNQLH